MTGRQDHGGGTSQDVSEKVLQAFLAQCRAERVGQGLPERVEDGATRLTRERVPASFAPSHGR